MPHAYLLFIAHIHVFMHLLSHTCIAGSSERYTLRWQAGTAQAGVSVCVRAVQHADTRASSHMGVDVCSCVRVCVHESNSKHMQPLLSLYNPERSMSTRHPLKLDQAQRDQLLRWVLARKHVREREMRVCACNHTHTHTHTHLNRPLIAQGWVLDAQRDAIRKQFQFQACICIYIYLYTYVYIYIYNIYIYVCVYIYLYMYMGRSKPKWPCRFTLTR